MIRTVSESKLGGSNAKPDPNLRLLVPQQPTTPVIRLSLLDGRFLRPLCHRDFRPPWVWVGQDLMTRMLWLWCPLSGGRCCLSVCQDSGFNIERCAPLCLDFNIWTSALKTTFLLPMPLPLPSQTYLYASSVRLHHLLYSLPFEPESGKYWPASEYGREWQMFHAG